MRKAFTLIELIFVIVIIGLLAAIAVPKFLNLKQHAEANSVVKTTVDAAQQATEAAVNYIDLDNNKSVTLRDILNLKGKGWSYSVPSDTNGSYEYNISNGNNNYTVAEINFSVPSREVNYSINCQAFDNAGEHITYKKCKALIGNKDSVSATLNY